MVIFAIRAVSGSKSCARRCQCLARVHVHRDLVGLYTHVANKTFCLVLWHRCDPCRFIRCQKPWLTPGDSTFPLTWRASLIIQLFKEKKGKILHLLYRVIIFAPPKVITSISAGYIGTNVSHVPQVRCAPVRKATGTEVPESLLVLVLLPFSTGRSE